MREHIEWLNYWIENADNEEQKRILLLGDSVAREYRKILNQIVMDEGYIVDLIAMSYSIFDKEFTENIQHFKDTVGSQYQHTFIIFHAGAHHGYARKCKDNDAIQKEYYQKLIELFADLERITNKIITVSGTPENEDCLGSNNEEIEIRNQILREVSRYYGYPYVELFSQLKIKNFQMADKCHYLDEGYEYMAYELRKAIGFQCETAPLNMVSRLCDFIKILERARHIFIYGDGKRGKLVYRYLEMINRKAAAFLVSDEFYHKDNQNRKLLKDVIEQLGDQGVVIMTPESNVVRSKLYQIHSEYYMLSKRIYTYLEEYVNAYS